MTRTTAAAFALMLIATPFAEAGQADVVAAAASKTGDAWRFEATVAHGDTGWEHYADAWRIVGEDGTVYGTRVLAHPHVNEQPFTRSLGGVRIPEGITRVRIEARDSVHGWGGGSVWVTLE
ncbi:MAG: hypothetical protein AAF565_03265 [Pseudomonadota bacterium]